jgi:hypothetical protein
LPGIEALRLDPLPPVIWMQLGVIEEEASARSSQTQFLPPFATERLISQDVVADEIERSAVNGSAPASLDNLTPRHLFGIWRTLRLVVTDAPTS